MDHTEVREALSAGEASPSVESHVASCEACSAWVSRLDAVRRVATDVLPPAPADLADRVITAVRAEAAPATTTLRSIAVVPLARRLRVRALTAAAVATAIAAGSVLVAKTTTQTPAERLVAAVRKTEAKRSVVFFMSSDLRIVLTRPIKVPRPETPNPFGHLPDGIRPEVETVPLYPEEIRAFRTESMATGQGVMPDRWRLSGTSVRVRTEPEAPLWPMMPAMVDNIVVGERSWMRAPATKGKWIAIEDAPATLGVDPGRFLRLAAVPTGARELGEEGEGEDRTRRYRFTSTRGGTMVVDVWVGGEDGLIRRMEVRIERADVTGGVASGRVNVSFVKYGDAIRIDPPASSDIISADELDEASMFPGLLMITGFRISAPSFRSWPMPGTASPRPMPTPSFIRPTFEPMPRWTPPEPEGELTPGPEPSWSPMPEPSEDR